MEKRLYKSQDKMVCGVCAGIAEYFGVDPTLVRLGTVVLTLAGSTGFWAYVLAAIIMPEAPAEF